MARPLFSKEELEELRRFDAQLDESFEETEEERNASLSRDAAVLRLRKAADPERERQRRRAWYEKTGKRFSARIGHGGNRGLRSREPGNKRVRRPGTKRTRRNITRI